MSRCDSQRIESVLRSRAIILNWRPMGLTYVDGSDWRPLRQAAQRELEFVLADGTPLGAVTLETLGLVLNPLTRRLQPMRMLLARLLA